MPLGQRDLQARLSQSKEERRRLPERGSLKALLSRLTRQVQHRISVRYRGVNLMRPTVPLFLGFLVVTGRQALGMVALTNMVLHDTHWELAYSEPRQASLEKERPPGEWTLQMPCKRHSPPLCLLNSLRSGEIADYGSLPPVRQLWWVTLPRFG